MITLPGMRKSPLGASCSPLGIAAVALCCQLAWRPCLAGDVLDKTIKIDIPANTNLENAIIEWGTEVGVTVMINTATVERQVAPVVRGSLNARKALMLILRGSGLSYTEENGRIRIVPAAGLVPSGLWVEEQPSAPVSSDLNASGPAGAEAAESNGSASVDDQESSERTRRLSEVIVTAQKREERAQDVPVPLTALDASTLVENAQFRLADYFAQIPGLNLSPGSTGQEQLAIRGITTGGNTNPTVAVVIDDVPISSSSAVTDNANWIPDIDPSDLARVEVLRGPQGTLYGADSLGGIIKYVTVDPSTERFSARIQSDFSHTQNGDGLGYGVRGWVNVPLTDTLAIRASAFSRKDAGYVNDGALTSDGINQNTAEGGRFSAMWKPSEDFSLRISAMLQETLGHGTADVEPQLGVLQQDLLRNTGWWTSHINMYDATIKAKIAGMDLTAVTGYIINADAGTADFTVLGPNVALYNTAVTKKFSQEVRLSSSIGKTFDWLLGAFYTREHSPVDQLIYTEDLTTGLRSPPDDNLLINFNFPLSDSEYALFADGTVHFTDQLSLQLGARGSHNSQSFSEVDTGPYVILFDNENSPAVYNRIHLSASPFTYLATPEYKINPDLMIYARIATGYRQGGPNSNAGLLQAPTIFQPDKTHNYEIGVKGDALNHAITFEGSIYYIDWKDIQIEVSNAAGAAFFANAGNAKSEGVELTQIFRPLTGMRINLWEVWNEAVLTQAFPQSTNLLSSSYGQPGDRLPFSSRWSGNLAVDQDFPLGAKAIGYFRASASYVGNRLSGFTGGPGTPRTVLPSYVETDLVGGVRYRGWTIDVFARNLADQRGQLSEGSAFDGNRAYLYIRPRTVGLSCAYAF